MVSTKKYFAVDVKSTDDGSFTGILSTYGNVDLVGDVCERGCFDASIGSKGTHFPLLWNHNDNEPIGSFDVIGTDVNLSIQGKFNLQVGRARDIHALMKAGDVKGLSIGYIPKKFTYDQDGIRHLTEVELFEGSVTPFPANPLATAEAKKMNENFVAFKSSIIRELKAKGMTDEEINAIVEKSEAKDCGECQERKEEEKPTEGEEPTDKPEEKPADQKEEDEPPKDNGLTQEEIDQLKKLCKDLKEEAEKLKEEMKE